MIKNSPFPTILIAGGTEEQREKAFEKIAQIELKTAVNNPDFFLLTSKTGLGIEEIRNLQKSLQLKPFKAKKKIALIKEAHQLTPAAQNALLKTLEEPGPNSLIILTTPDSFLLLPTIVSRCQVIGLTEKSEIRLKEEKVIELAENLSQLFQASVAERFCLAEEKKLYENRQKALSWIDELTFISRQQLLAFFLQEKQTPWKALVSTLRLLEKTKKRLLANCNLRLTLEVFLSQMPKLTES